MTAGSTQTVTQARPTTNARNSASRVASDTDTAVPDEDRTAATWPNQPTSSASAARHPSTQIEPAAPGEARMIDEPADVQFSMPLSKAIAPGGMETGAHAAASPQQIAQALPAAAVGRQKAEHGAGRARTDSQFLDADLAWAADPPRMHPARERAVSASRMRDDSGAVQPQEASRCMGRCFSGCSAGARLSASYATCAQACRCGKQRGRRLRRCAASEAGRCMGRCIPGC